MNPSAFAVVQVPREMFTEGLWSQPFDNLHKLATSEWRGLIATTARLTDLPAAPPDTVWLRRGTDGQALVYQQNWGGWPGTDGIGVFARAR